MRDLDLTSARWQVLGAVALEGRPLTVAQIARRIGLSRQAVQRVANDLTAEDLATFLDNPDHKRAKLLALTEQGRSAYAEADARQIAGVNALGEGLDPSAIGQAVAIMRIIRDRCQSQAGGDENPYGGKDGGSIGIPVSSLHGATSTSGNGAKKPLITKTYNSFGVAAKPLPRQTVLSSPESLLSLGLISGSSSR